MKIKDYPYLYETHLHTNEASACANNSGYDMAKAAKEYGYAGIIVTNHNWGGNTCVDRSLDWETWVNEFAKGYYSAKEYGDANDLDVFFGYESGYKGTEFLIYGITPEWMIEHPGLWNATVEEQYKLVHDAGGMVIHAHPYRDEWYIPEIRLYPDYVDGVEGINATHSSHLSGNHNNPEFDKLAIEYANKYKLPITAGSDIHSTFMFGGGVVFKRRINSIEDYCRAILSGEDYVLTNGDMVYNKYGEALYAV